MTALKSRYVILLFFITQFLYQSYGETTDKIRYLDKLLSLQSLATGYIHNPNHYERQKLEKEWSSELYKKIVHLYDELECGYFYNAQFHFRLTGDAIFGNDENVLTSETIEDFSFVKEANIMINSLLDLRENWMDDLWLLYICARQIRDFFGQIVNGGKSKSEILKEIKLLRDYVLSVIKGHLKRCNSKNCFNMKSNEHWSMADDPHKKKSLSLFHGINAQTFGENSDGVMSAIKRNKQLLYENFNANRNKKLLEFSTTELISNELVLFENEKSCNLFFDEFLMANSEPVNFQFPSKLTGIRLLGEYQNRVIGTLKIIMLQILLSYTVLIRDLEDANPKLIYFIDKFVDLMALNTDWTFISNFRNPKSYEAKYALNPLYKSWSPIEKYIKWLIRQISIKHNLPEIKSIVTESDQSEPLKHILEVGTIFVEKIEKQIGKRSIRLVQSFLKMIKKTFLPQPKDDYFNDELY